MTKMRTPFKTKLLKTLVDRSAKVELEKELVIPLVRDFEGLISNVNDGARGFVKEHWRCSIIDSPNVGISQIIRKVAKPTSAS